MSCGTGKWAELGLVCFICFFSVAGFGQDELRVYPYLQNPAPDGMTVIWFTHDAEPGELWYRKRGSDDYNCLHSNPEPALKLDYSDWESTTFFPEGAPPLPYGHRLRVEGLDPGSLYEYKLLQGQSEISAMFRTAPAGDTAIRFIVYSDSETEPESSGAYTSWPDNAGVSRSYMVDQSTAYSNNLAVMRSREPDLVFIAGDLVQCGGEQRDWDEFWRHNAGPEIIPGLASEIPIMPVLGNHEYYEGTLSGLYFQPQSEQALDKYQRYFELPENHAPNKDQEGRYYACKYGPASFIVLDVCNNGLNASDEDTNFYLLGESDSAGGNAPDFGPGSRQYIWLEERLAEAQKDLFTFVIFHHAPYSSGPHGFPPGNDSQQDDQSGVPARQLTPLFFKYGVDAVFSGHDEMWERSVLSGVEDLPDGSRQQYNLHFYDVGTGGDGLREPREGSDNPYLAFLAHRDAPEIWADSVLLEGGRHYGHLEVNISSSGQDRWEALLDPVYVLPQKASGETNSNTYIRKLYNDRVSLVRYTGDTTISSGLAPSNQGNASGNLILNSYPNPFHEEVLISLSLAKAGALTFKVYDLMGRLVYSERPVFYPAGSCLLSWKGVDHHGHSVPPGIYQGLIQTGRGPGNQRPGATIRLIKN